METNELQAVIKENKDFVKVVCEEALKALAEDRDMERFLKDMIRDGKVGLMTLV